MGTFHTGCKITNVAHRSQSILVKRLLVDTGSEFTWISERRLEAIGVKQEKKDIPFVMANGKVITRAVGFLILQIKEYFTIDEVVFAQDGDMQLLGARTLEGLNLTIDTRRKRLVAAGPQPVALSTVHDQL